MKTTSKANPGDHVEIHLMRRIYEGVLIESPEDEKGMIVLKLDTGYNIGFNRKDITEIRVRKRFSEKTPGVAVKKDAKKPNIAMIITGGTISARLNPGKGGVDWLDTPESLFRFYPEIFEKANIVKVEVPFMKASEDMDFKDWRRIAEACKSLLNDKGIKGVIVTHGTDFLHYTSAALSFFLQSLNKPVVLTYSQRSIDRASSDAKLNLQCSVVAALSDIAEVMLVGHATANDDYCHALPGTKVRKMHTSQRDAFKAVNSRPFAKIVPNANDSRIEVMSDYRVRDEKRKVVTNTKFNDKVALVKVYPGQDPRILDFYLKEGYKGLVLEASGLGHVPGRRSRISWIKKLKEIQKKGVIVCATSQAIFGKVDPWVYSNAREILGTGVFYLEDMLSETALVKLGWVLGQKKTPNPSSKEFQAYRAWVSAKMLEDISHELNKKLEFHT
jgi:glutamyl-tRNA(Gln) amidotransferase subunit D